MPSAESWKRRYERAEAGRLEALGQLRDASLKLIDTSADEMQQQLDALEQLVLKRTALVDVQQMGRKVQFTFTRRGAIHRVECYGAMDMSVGALRKQLVED